MNRREFIAAGSATLILPGCASVARAPAVPQSLVWQKLPTVPFRGKQDDIAFGSSSHGWYGNGEGRVYRTADGGDSWTQVWHQPGTFVRALGFFDGQRGILGNVGPGAFPNVTDQVPLYHTADGGSTWIAARIEGPRPGGICAIEIHNSAHIDRGERVDRMTAHAAGRVGGPAHYLRSSDRGASWRSADLSALTAAIYDVKFIDSRTGFIAGSSSPDLAQARGLILRTDDGGDSWREVFRSARAFETVWKLHFPTSGIGYGTVQSYDRDAANSRRFVAKTMDGGRTWSEVPLVDSAAWRSFGIGFADENIGWVGGATGGLETRDGGRSWAPAEMGRAVNKIRFVGSGRSRRAYAIGSDVHRLDLGWS